MNLNFHAMQRARSFDIADHRPLIAVSAAIVSFALVVLLSTTPSTSISDARHPAAEPATQTFAVPHDAQPAEVIRSSYTGNPGYDTFIAGGTNYDWAKLVLLYGGFPVTDNNVTVITRWMRQENYIDSWWNRNNPLNNGWGSGGGGGLGSYDSLVAAAQYAATALHGLDGYRPIVEAFAASAPTHVTEAAIWGSPWASGHYANGAHWHYSPVPVVKAPPSAW